MNKPAGTHDASIFLFNESYLNGFKVGHILIILSQMYRKGRLSVHRKNEFRKHRAEKKGSCTVTITHLFPVSVPKADISLFKISIPKEYYLNVILKSLDNYSYQTKSRI